MKVELTHNAGTRREFPADSLPEVAVLGRSNVGKSSLINALLGRRKLARTSQRPGKTRRIHFYRVNDAFYLVDLPGYGYSAAPKEERRSWRPMVESYLRGEREALRGALVLVDVRRGPQEEEGQLLEWLEVEGIPAAIVLTNSDKLARSRAAEARRAISKETSVPEDRLALVSARTRAGLDTLHSWIGSWTGIEIP